MSLIYIPKSLTELGLYNLPLIPTLTSQLTNDSGFLTNGSIYELKSNKGIASGYADLDGLVRLPKERLPTKLLNQYWHASYDEKTVVSGTWSQVSDASQTDFDDALTSVAGYLYSNTATNNDEVHFGNLTFNAGTYKISIGYVKAANGGILEILHDTTSLGTQDTYAALTYNQVVSFTYSPTTRKTGNLRLKASGKNAGSSAYRLHVSRIEIIRTG